MLKTSFEIYSVGQSELLFVKALDESLEEITGSGIDNYGIRDALQILSVGPSSITFAPLWVDNTHITTSKHEHSKLAAISPFRLNRPFKAGAPMPLAEILTPNGWRSIPVTLVSGKHKNPLSPDDLIFLNYPVTAGRKIRFIYHPDASNFPDTAMTLAWKDNLITRTYKGKTESIPKYKIPGVKLSDLKFKYFDNTNTKIEPRAELIPNITAVKASLEINFGNQKRNGSNFINLRNTRVVGTGLIIQKGTKLKIPDSSHIRVFSISNIIGVKKGDLIELEARPEKGSAWKIKIELDFDQNTPIIRKYSVEYPSGMPVYSKTVNLSLTLPLNFMNLDTTGRYDYDYDKNTTNVVNVEGDVELVITKMEPNGAALFIRP